MKERLCLYSLALTFIRSKLIDMKRVRITSTKNTTYDAIKARRHNIWMGISLGNKYFNKDHLARYLSWAVSYTKEKMLLIVADEIHAINYEVFEKLPSSKALEKAMKKGDEMCSMLRELLRELPPEHLGKIEIIRWEKITALSSYQAGLVKIEKLTARDPEFLDLMIDIVRINLGERVYNLKEAELAALARYVILEFPIFLGPLEYKGVVYDLNVYPGLSLLDDVVIAIQDKLFYKELTEGIADDKKLAIAEVYAE